MAIPPGAAFLLPQIPASLTLWICLGALLFGVAAVGLKLILQAAARFEGCPHCAKPILRGKSVCYLCMTPLASPPAKSSAPPRRPRPTARLKGGAQR